MRLPTFEARRRLLREDSVHVSKKDVPDSLAPAKMPRDHGSDGSAPNKETFGGSEGMLSNLIRGRGLPAI